jgi:hypothetical protein
MVLEDDEVAVRGVRCAALGLGREKLNPKKFMSGVRRQLKIRCSVGALSSIVRWPPATFAFAA